MIELSFLSHLIFFLEFIFSFCFIHVPHQFGIGASPATSAPLFSSTTVVIIASLSPSPRCPWMKRHGSPCRLLPITGHCRHHLLPLSSPTHHRPLPSPPSPLPNAENLTKRDERHGSPHRLLPISNRLSLTLRHRPLPSPPSPSPDVENLARRDERHGSPRHLPITNHRSHYLSPLPLPTRHRPSPLPPSHHRC